LLNFTIEKITPALVVPAGHPDAGEIQVRYDPLTSRSCRLTFARAGERESGTDELPEPPPAAMDTRSCPFCQPQVNRLTPTIDPRLSGEPRLRRGESILFPNLFPYGRYSAVSVIDNRHFVPIGTADADAYLNCLLNCRDYLEKVLTADIDARHVAITQNHLPAAGGSLVHPHLQIQADAKPTNFLRFLSARADSFYRETGRLLLSTYLEHELAGGERLIGRTGDWHWLAAFAPEGFYEIWGILPEAFSLLNLKEKQWRELAAGIINTQRFYRSLNRNGYNLGLLAVESGDSRLELRARIVVRANYSQWARNDHTGFEVMLGDMATFTAPEQTAATARKFWG